MKTSVRAGLAGVLACGVLGAAITIHRGGDPAPPRGPYVALGDSYTAGPKIPARHGTPAGCDRSDHDYPALVAAELGLAGADFRDVSCSGATLDDLSAAQSTDDGTNPAQFSALSARTRLVTVGMGGNDIGFSSLVKRCVTAGAFYFATGKYLKEDAPCRDRYVSGDTDAVRQRIRDAGGKLARALAEVERRAPEARVYVVGYPAILPADGKGCGGEMAMAPGDITYLHDKARQLNAVLRQRAEAAGARYVDTYRPSVGHDACAASGTRWIEPLFPDAPAAPVHPNARGERGMADAVLTSLRASG
ncbi:SGNH/GDSL hydrolase family protein [Streptomyces sp. NPDC088350]|uniref:SGNH/GDSL hydrolase family protein n=1 Tax=Streptomyces sp. NPDC088350 TaxID=3365854 RepID=UPI00382156AB